MVRGEFDLPAFTHWGVMPYSQVPIISSLMIYAKESLVSPKRTDLENTSLLQII